jgi:nickel-dependent lactate racemase
MQITVPYGRGLESAEVAAERVLGVAQMEGARPLDDLPGAVQRALDHPVGPPLDEVIHRGDRVLVMTVDHTRPNPSPLLWPLMERLESLGARPEIFIGLGNHRPMTGEELDRFLGTHAVHQNASRAEDQWRLGQTTNGTPIEVSPILREFDRRIVLGFIEPHYIAGFSGGRKMILPGAASYAATTRNHFLTLLHGPQLGRIEGNPVHEDMLQAAQAVGVDLILDAVLGPDDSFCSLHCGALEAAHAQGVARAREAYTWRAPQRADIVICASGGWPYDCDMVQAKKCLAPALQCVKPGGAVILVGECANGWGASEPEWRLLRAESVLAVREQIAGQLRQGGLSFTWPPCSPGVLFSRVVHDHPAELYVVSALNDQLADSYLTPAASLAEALARAQQRLGSDASVIVIPEGRRTLCAPGE